MTIPVTTRAGKGSALTPTEMDTNLTNLARNSSTTVQGNVRLATSGEAGALSDATLAISPTTIVPGINGYFSLLASIGGISVAQNGFYSLPAGPIIQWGVHNFTGGPTTQTITLPKVFPNNNWVSMTQAFDAGGGLQNTLFVVGAQSTSNFTIKLVSGDTSAFVHWICIGN